jgi:hypothetical protein
MDDVNKKDHSFWGYDMCLVLWDYNKGGVLYIPFSKSDPVSCVSVVPGRYRIAGYVVTCWPDRAMQRGLFKSPLADSFSVKGDTAIYLGDYFGHTFIDSMVITRGMNKITNNFADTTSYFHDKYPNLASIPTQSVFDLLHTNEVSTYQRRMPLF